MSRPTKRTPELEKALLDQVRAGLGKDRAADAVGIARQTLYEWDKRIPTFSDALKKAQADFQTRMLLKIEQAAEDPKHWTAAAWRLERLFPDEFARRDRLQVGGDLQGSPIIIDINPGLLVRRRGKRAKRKEVFEPDAPNGGGNGGTPPP